MGTVAELIQLLDQVQDKSLDVTLEGCDCGGDWIGYQIHSEATIAGRFYPATLDLIRKGGIDQGRRDGAVYARPEYEGE